jgi:hypothetical protein
MHQPRAVDDLIEMTQLRAPRKIGLAANNGQGQRRPRHESQSALSGETGIFRDALKQFLHKSFFGSRFDLDPVDLELDILAWTSMRNRLLGARTKPRMTHELAGPHTRLPE